MINSIISCFASVKDSGSPAVIECKSADFDASETYNVLVFFFFDKSMLHYLQSMFITTPEYDGSYNRPKYLRGSMLPLV